MWLPLVLAATALPGIPLTATSLKTESEIRPKPRELNQGYRFFCHQNPHDPRCARGTTTVPRPLSWQLNRISQNCPSTTPAFTMPATGGAGVTVYVLDAGPIRLSHVEFADKKHGTVENGFQPRPAPSGQYILHSTHVAGCAVGATTGSAPYANMVGVGVLGLPSENPELECDPGPRFGGSCSYMIEAIEWVIKQRTHGPKIITASRQPKDGLAYDPQFQRVLQKAAEANIFVLISAGNGDNIDACLDGYCKYDHVFCVGGTGPVPGFPTPIARQTPNNQDNGPGSEVFFMHNITYDPPDARDKWYANAGRSDSGYSMTDGLPLSATSARTASFYSYNGECVDLFSPGDRILGPSNVADNAYAYVTGTSQATPVTAGAAALVWSEHPHWEAVEVGEHLKKMAEPSIVGGMSLAWGLPGRRPPTVAPGTELLPGEPTPRAYPEAECWTNLTSGGEVNPTGWVPNPWSANFDPQRRYWRPCAESRTITPNVLLNVGGLIGKGVEGLNTGMKASSVLDALGCAQNDANEYKPPAFECTYDRKDLEQDQNNMLVGDGKCYMK